MTVKPTRNVRLDPMTAQEFGPWRAKTASDYAMAQVREGHWSIETAQQQGWDVTEGLLPAGPETYGQHLWIARDVDTEQRVGSLWVALRTAGPTTEAFVYDVHVEEELRGVGYGRAIMEAATAAARALGAEYIALNVHGSNDRAYQLYKGLGYEVTNLHMRLGL
ncbi:GNAT family N-acetyltransferase [Catenulispora sp. NF23]|uniref:GNAT family N-acetyltransferase n=1 Tax=Catenulispora pinistramenti TaxID=2705254 RepID=A0ABS5KTU1_9ACTN|nr:GNAT family N-acetyltransferase [Catenulispora pinistramenti]MBS2537082.1 GNAT family N-acetyltransferase [Catenulispora pinistramenti]MBS2549471.1 GNAT family N-acetyltransferase [Catenulispora pinistramenti]